MGVIIYACCNLNSKRVMEHHDPPQHGSRNTYRQISNIRRTFIGNEIVDHSDVVGASHVGAAPTTSSFST